MPSPGPTRSEPRPRPRPIQVRFGPAAGLILLGGGVIVAARVFGAVPLFVVGIGFVLLGLLAPAWVLIAARGSTVSRQLAVHRAVEDEPIEAIVHIRRGWVGLPGAQLHDPMAGATMSVAELLSVLGGRRRAQLRVVARLPHRGRHRFAPPDLTVSDALGLTQVRRPGLGAVDEILILPRTEPVRWLYRAPRQASSGHLHHSTHEPMGAGEVDGLRQYVPGTSASRIHWPAVARGAGLLERRLVAEMQSQPLVVLDARKGAAGSDPELLDAAVRAAASLTLELARGGGCQLLLPGERTTTLLTPDLAGWPALHTRLALVEEETDPRRGPALRRGAARGSVILVSVRPDSPTALGGVIQAGQLVLVLPSQLGVTLEVPASFEVSGCTGYILRSASNRRRRAAA